MLAALCLDDRCGLSFNHRRLSRDRAQQEDLLLLCKGSPLWLAPYSAPLFQWAADRVTVDETLLGRAGPGELCFLEDRLPPMETAEGLILYRWNRAYPADVYFRPDLSAFVLAEQTEFPGTSHEVITREIYLRKEC